MKDKSVAKQIILLLLFSYIFLFHGIGDYSLKEPDEGRYAEIPREMNELHDYTVPHLNYVRYFEKPPLLYWADALSYKAFGISEWAFRFPNAFAAFLVALLLYAFGRQWLGEKTGFLSALILLTSIAFFSMARIVTTDMLFTLFLFLSLAGFCEYYRSGKAPFIYLFYGAAAVATLAKGPVAVILLGGTIIVFLVTEKNLRFIRSMKFFPGIALYCVITLPWIIAISLREKGFLYFFFMDQHVLRFLTSKHKRSGPIYYFLPVLFGGLFPWSVFIPRALADTWRKRELRLLLIWSTIVFLFFSVSGSKLPPYILPMFPSMALILGAFFCKQWEEEISRWVEGAVYGFVFALFAGSYFLPRAAIFMNYIQDISGEALQIAGELRFFSLAVSLCSLVILILLFVRSMRRHARMFMLLASFSLVLITGILSCTSVVDRLNTAKSLALIIKSENPVPDYVINYSSYEQTLPFYLQRRITIASYKGELQMGSEYNDSKGIFIDHNQFLQLVGSDKRVLFVTKQKRLPLLETLVPGRLSVRSCQNERCLVSNYRSSQ